jgi:DNA-binding protein HU-beta
MEGGADMNQSELVTIVADDTNLNRVEAALAVESMLSAIAHELAVGGDVRLMRFGRFTVALSPTREGRNPYTGEKIKIAAKRRPRFTAAKALKETINKPVRLTGARRRA